MCLALFRFRGDRAPRIASLILVALIFAYSIVESIEMFLLVVAENGLLAFFFRLSTVAQYSVVVLYRVQSASNLPNLAAAKESYLFNRFNDFFNVFVGFFFFVYVSTGRRRIGSRQSVGNDGDRVPWRGRISDPVDRN